MGGGCFAKEGKDIKSGTEFKVTFTFLINQSVSKFQIILMSLSFKAEKKVKKQKKKKKREDYVQRKKNPREL